MGPTGVGKTDLAIELYNNLGINIISVDSVQIYKHLNIGSGKPSSNVLDKYPHDLIDILKPNESYSTSQFQDDVIDSIRKAFQTKRIPFLVGGTMMYFHHLVNGISKLPSVDSQIRLRVKEEFEDKGVHEMYKYLEKIDKNSTFPRDRYRMTKNFLDEQKIMINFQKPNFVCFDLFSPGTGPGTSKFEISGSKSPRGLIQSLGGWNRTDFCNHNGRRRYGLDGMD